MRFALKHALRGQFVHGWAGMRMGDGHAQRIGRILTRQDGQLQQTFDHFLDLRLGCSAVPGDGLLHLQSGVFGDRQVARHQSRDTTAPRLAQQQVACGLTLTNTISTEATSGW